ncbi:unnamed protein product [Pylaiella littoralis]
MRLITHNMLESNIKGVETGFPLGIEVVKTEEQELEFNADFISNMLDRLDWAALRAAAVTLGAGDLPEEVTEEMKGDEEALRRIHHALMEVGAIKVHLVEGELVCPESGRKFPVRQGVPNMLLHEDEI